MDSIKQFYDNYSYKYEDFESEALTNKNKYPLLYEIRQKERQFLDKGVNKKVLYFATGSGSDVSYLAKIGAQIFTLDFSIEMINRTIDKLKKENIKFELVKDVQLTAETLDKLFKENLNKVIILHADFQDVDFPRSYFDYVFCYCTLPLIIEDPISALKKLLHTAKNGVVSVYKKDMLPILKDYYIDFGFKSWIEDRTIYIEGGFAYCSIPPEELIKVIRQEKKLDIFDVGLGNIYVWQE